MLIEGLEGRKTALMKAALGRHAKVLELLLSYGAQTDFQDREGKTALMKASFDEYKEVVELLLIFNARVNIQDKNNKTAISYGLANQEIDALLRKALLEQTKRNIPKSPDNRMWIFLQRALCVGAALVVSYKIYDWYEDS